MAASALFGKFANHLQAEILPSKPGIQLYTVGKELRNDAPGTMKELRSIGYIEVETAGMAGLNGKCDLMMRGARGSAKSALG